MTFGITVTLTPSADLLPVTSGTLARCADERHDGGSLVPVTVRSRAYRKGVLVAEDFPLADLSEQLEQPDTHVWLDICWPDKAALEMLASELGLHPLAVEDALEPHQRAKIDRYSTHAFLAAHAVRLDTEVPVLSPTEVDAFIGVISRLSQARK